MNPDKLSGDQLCAGSSHRKFKGRQGSPTGPAILMNPALVVISAVADACVVFEVRKMARV